MSDNEGASEGALARLAAHFGIEASFGSAHGGSIATSPDIQRRLLRAMRVEADTEEDAISTLSSARRSDQERMLPPVIVLWPAQERSAVDFEVTGRPPREWRLDLEDGETRSGPVELRGRGRGAGSQLARLRLGEVPYGYHMLTIPQLGVATSLIVTPGKCWLPDQFEQGSGLWGIAVQLYLLRSEKNWGVGDFSDLAQLIAVAAEKGCSFIGVNPLHQMFLDSPEQASPYSPLSRLFLNVLCIAVPEAPGYSSSAAVQELVNSPEFNARLSSCRSASLVDYAEVTHLKLSVLRILHREFETRAPDVRRRYAAFRDEHSATLSQTSIYQALRQHFLSEDCRENADWRDWPAQYRDAHGDAVKKFAVDHAEEVDFLSWLQWVADEQLAKSARCAAEAGMPIGLYRDLAVGCDHSGAETWADPDAFLTAARVGAPPDIFNPAGQDWGLPPPHPINLRLRAYESFIDLLRSNMRHAGGLRIDHVMALQHLYCIPDGSKPAEGAYISYPFDDLIGIVALESNRNRCLVVGEDLGTVPEGFREKMASANVLSYRVLFFEQEPTGGQFKPPDAYPLLALAVAGSHDLPTLIAWWRGADIDLKDRLGLYPDEEEAKSQRRRRENDRASILEALQAEGMIDSADSVTEELFAVCAHEFLARSGAGLVASQLDDLLREADQVNIPGTVREHPNWRRKYSMTIDELACNADAWQLAASLPERRRWSGQDG